MSFGVFLIFANVCTGARQNPSLHVRAALLSHLKKHSVCAAIQSMQSKMADAKDVPVTLGVHDAPVTLKVLQATLKEALTPLENRVQLLENKMADPKEAPVTLEVLQDTLKEALTPLENRVQLLENKMADPKEAPVTLEVLQRTLKETLPQMLKEALPQMLKEALVPFENRMQALEINMSDLAERMHRAETRYKRAGR
jgi:chromosome segregation ATPase